MTYGEIESANREQVPLERTPDRTDYPLSFNQREMWAQCQLYSGTCLNNLAVAVELTGRLDVGSFRQAFQAVVDRHDTMRTAFPAPDGSPMQRVEPVRARMALRDLTHMPAGAQAECVRVRGEALVRLPFRLERAPLFRAELLRLAADRSVFVFVFHHLILDGFYLQSFLEDLARVYACQAAGADRLPPPPPRQYGDFAVWQERTLAAGLLDEHQGFWRAQLRAPLPPMAIPWDRQPTSLRTFANDAVVRRLPADLSAALEALRARCETTTFRILTAAFEVLLWRMTGQRDLLLAMPFSMRPDEMCDAIGFFGNTLPLRATLNPDQRFDCLIGDVTAQVRTARARRAFPLTEALRSLDLQRDHNRPALPICISQVRRFAASAGELRMKADFPFARGSTFDLWLMVAADGEGIALALNYAVELFDTATIAAVADALEALLASIVANPEVPIRALELVSASDRLRVQAWGDGGPPLAGCDGGVGAELAAVAARMPASVAVVADGEPWTYARLHEAAGRVAAALGASAAGREARVGILGTRSPGMLATVIGVLDAGAAFVPLEAGQPDARLQAIVRAAGMRVVMADRAYVDRAHTLVAGVEAPVRVVCWDDVLEDYGTPSAPGMDGEQGPTDLAYIFFTSGSTGTPKGVMVEQRAMRNHLRAKIAALDLDATSVVVQNASYGFDIVVWQWLAALLVGGRVVIYDEATAEDPAALLAALARDGATVVETVPSFLEALVEAAGRPAAPSLPALRWMVSNAEALPPAVAHRWRACYPTVRLLNTYGATECADDTTHGEVVAASHAAAARVPVGGPIPGANVAVVDELLRPVPPGCAGEIVLGGTAIGRGYLGDPAATASAFVPDPLSDAPGGRLYRTGDRGRWRADGVLECLGRQDDQVKLHGYRVELGEVEAALATLPALSQVAAAVRTDARGHRRLVAYYAAPAPCDPGVLRSALAARLPAYMVPDAWMWLTALPRTQTGKLNRLALPAPLAEAVGRSAPPATPLEAAVAAVWQQVLQVSSVGRHDNFFDLGGDSIQSILVASRLSQRGFRLTARDVLAHQTIAELAQVVTPEPSLAD